MNFYLSSIEIRGYSDNKFSTLRTHAVREAFWATLTGKDMKLARFPEGTFQKGINRKLIGVMDIPVEKIIGTLYRHSDFDHEFRPLKRNLRDRWVNIYLLLESEGWSPILVHKVEDHYYVEDGHHRVSVARALGIQFIQANVLEYPSNKPSTRFKTVECNEGNLVGKCVTVPE